MVRWPHGTTFRRVKAGAVLGIRDKTWALLHLATGVQQSQWAGQVCDWLHKIWGLWVLTWDQAVGLEGIGGRQCGVSGSRERVGEGCGAEGGAVVPKTPSCPTPHPVTLPSSEAGSPPKARPALLPPLPGTGPAMPKTLREENPGGRWASPRGASCALRGCPAPTYLPGLPPAATPGPRKLLTSARPWGWLAGAKGITGPLPGKQGGW